MCVNYLSAKVLHYIGQIRLFKIKGVTFREVKLDAGNPVKRRKRISRTPYNVIRAMCFNTDSKTESIISKKLCHLFFRKHDLYRSHLKQNELLTRKCSFKCCVISEFP